MPNRPSKPKRPRDINQLAKALVDEATAEPEAPIDPICEAARALGRRGGLKGGPARAAKLSKEERSEIGKNAAKARWGKPGDQS